MRNALVIRHVAFEDLGKLAPTLGICLGAQLIARALGARVYATGNREIGYAPIELTPARRGSALRHLGAPATPVLHWHGDTFDLPARAMLLASTKVCANQAFSIDERILALQFHPEFEAALLERWLVGHSVELGLAGVDPNALRDQAARFGPELERRAARLWDEWLEGLDK